MHGAPLLRNERAAAMHRAHDADVDAWMARADRALYRAEGAGRDRSEGADPGP
jgi:PleD family two-component response regulator